MSSANADRRCAGAATLLEPAAHPRTPVRMEANTGQYEKSPELGMLRHSSPTSISTELPVGNLTRRRGVRRPRSPHGEERRVRGAGRLLDRCDDRRQATPPSRGRRTRLGICPPAPAGVRRPAGATGDGRSCRRHLHRLDRPAGPGHSAERLGSNETSSSSSADAHRPPPVCSPSPASAKPWASPALRQGDPSDQHNISVHTTLPFGVERAPQASLIRATMWSPYPPR